VLSKNQYRRHMTKDEKCFVAATMANLLVGRPKEIASKEAINKEGETASITVSQAEAGVGRAPHHRRRTLHGARRAHAPNFFQSFERSFEIFRLSVAAMEKISHRCGDEASLVFRHVSAILVLGQHITDWG